jgi:hypothetical protein
MSVRFVKLNESAKRPFEELLTAVWRHQWGPGVVAEVIRWRYYNRRSSGGTWLAFDGERCVALLDSYLRPYSLHGRRILVREPCDWFCLPEYRPRGLGTLLMRKIMADPEPIFSFNGSPASVAVLARLRWAPLPPVQRFVLPVKARSVAGTLLRRRWPAREGLAKIIPNTIRIRSPSQAAVAPGPLAEVRNMRDEDPASVLPLAAEGLFQILEQSEIDWLTTMPSGLARPIGLTFLLNKEPVGFSFSQVEPAASGFEGRILHLQVAPGAGQDICNWIVAETGRWLVREGAGIIRCLASAPYKAAALKSAGFLATKLEPACWWSRDRIPAPSQIDVGYLRADEAVPWR